MCGFIAHHENILICGLTGVGKSHVANAIACEALKGDFRVLCRSTQRLLADLHAARASASYSRMLAKVLAVDLLVLDDFGLQPIPPQGAQDLYQIISERYEHRSMIITSLSCRTDRVTALSRSGPMCSVIPCSPAPLSTGLPIAPTP